MTTSSPTIADNTLTTGLVGYWTFDRAHVVWADTTTEIKDTAGTNHGNALGSLAAGSLTVGKQGQALTFNGTSDYVQVADQDSFSPFVNDITVSLWANVPTSAGALGNGAGGSSGRYMITKGATEGDFEWGLENDNNSLICADLWQLNANNHANICSTSRTVNDGQWHQYVFSLDYLSSLILYIDGVQVATTNTFLLTMGNGASPIRIGERSDGNLFSGSLDDVRIYNRALSASEVYQLYTMGTDMINAPPEDPLSQGLLGYWKMDEGTGTSTTADASGNANTLTMTNMESGDWVAGNIGPYALDFDGSNEYLTVASPSILDFSAGESFSLTGWFNRSRTFDSDDTIIAKRNGQAASDDGYIVYIDDSTDTLVFEASDTDDGDEYQRVSSTTFTAAGWHQFAVTWNDSATTDPVNIYIDGALNNGTATGTFANIGDLTESVAFRIGAESDAGVPFDGSIDDIRVYGYPLSADEVKKLYQTTAPAQPVDTGLVGHWTFDGPDIQGTTAIDRSGKGNHGTITGATKTIGKLGQGLSFNGTSDSINAGSASSLDNIDLQGGGGMSISVWIKPRSAGFGSTGMIAAKDFGSDGEWHFYTGVSGRIGFAKTYSGVDLDVSSGDNTYSLNQWTHLVLTWDGSATATHIHIYANGVEASYVIQTNGTNTKQSDIAMSLFIGGAYGYGFDGIMDDLRIYNRALSSTEITNLYNSGK